MVGGGGEHCVQVSLAIECNSELRFQRQTNADAPAASIELTKAKRIVAR